MYNEYFGLNQAPFRITPDTALFYTGGGRGDVLDALVYAITSGEGIVKVVGEVGTGKTMLCRMLEERLPDNVQIAYLANPSLTPEDILHAVALELELDIAGDANRLQVMHRLQESLLARHANNQRVVVLVEEAQSMPVDTLEEIRLLSNLETKNEKLLQIVLFGQPELDDNLAKSQIRQLRERITHSFALTPLGREEVKDYVAFRLRASGYRGRDAFTSDAYRKMSRASEGLTRRVNIIADKAMLAAFADDTHDVSAKHVKSAIADSEFNASNKRRHHSPLLAMGMAASLAVVVAAVVGWYAGNQASSVSPSTPIASGVHAEQTVAKRSVAPAEVAVAEEKPLLVSAPDPVVTAPVSSVVSSTAESSGQVSREVPADPAPPQAAQDSQRLSTERVAGKTMASGTASAAIPAPPAEREVSDVAGAIAERASRVTDSQIQVSAAVQDVAGAVIADAEMTAPALEPRTGRAPSAATKATLSGGASLEPRKDAPMLAGTDAAQRMAPADKPVLASRADSRSAPSSASVDSKPPQDSSLLQWRLGQTRQWLRQVAKDRYSIQLLATDAEQRTNLEAFLARRKRAGQIEKIFVYTTRIHSREWYGVLFGEFESYSKAREALRELPRELLLHKPFIRNIIDIKALG